MAQNGVSSDTVQVIVGFTRLSKLRLKVKVPTNLYFSLGNSIPLTTFWKDEGYLDMCCEILSKNQYHFLMFKSVKRIKHLTL